VESCLECERCKGDNENYCPEQHDTYNDTNAAGDVLQGGYSTHIRADKRESLEIFYGGHLISSPTLYTDN
jgi:D-arabinose 1-dehydrogenase-like Zn-dependent alcohol dehydrogenase